MKAARALSLASRESQRELEGRVQRTDAGAEFVGRIRRIGRKKP